MCPACGWEPDTKQKATEDYVWYGYRKWRSLANHIVVDHCSSQALQHRRIVAREQRLKVMSIQRSKKSRAA